MKIWEKKIIEIETSFSEKVCYQSNVLKLNERDLHDFCRLRNLILDKRNFNISREFCVNYSIIIRKIWIYGKNSETIPWRVWSKKSKILFMMLTSGVYYMMKFIKKKSDSKIGGSHMKIMSSFYSTNNIFSFWSLW